jgi:3-oxoacyl-[acyl-carrier protein] reductase
MQGLVDTAMGSNLATQVNMDAHSMLMPSDVASATLFAASYTGMGNIGEIVLQPRESNNYEFREGWAQTMNRTLPHIKPIPGVAATPQDSKRVAFITGGSRGIGLAIAMVLAREHYHLVVVARDSKRLEEAKIQLLEAGAPHVAVHSVDVANCAAVLQLMREGVGNGRLCVCVSNAGINRRLNALGTSYDVLNHVLDTNLRSSAETCIEASKIMHYQKTQPGFIFIVGSTASNYPFRGSPGMLPYYMTKQGQLGLLIGLNEDMRQFG